MNPRDAFERILDSLHRAALDYGHWPSAAALIEEAVDTVSSCLGVSVKVSGMTRPSTSSGTTVAASAGAGGGNDG